MARITIEDCLDKIGNHFQLVLAASRRARQLQLGDSPRIEVTDEKPGIIALREIAAGLVGKEIFTEPVYDAAADSELAELIGHEIRNQKHLGRAPGDADEDEDGLGGGESLRVRSSDENGSGAGEKFDKKEDAPGHDSSINEAFDLPAVGTNGGNGKKD